MDPWKVVALASSGALALVLFHCGGAPATSPAATPAAAAAPSGESEMMLARDELATARRYLDDAIPDKGGHREQAVRLVDQAVFEINQGVAFASSGGRP